MKKAYCVTEGAAKRMAMNMRSHGLDAEAVGHSVNIHERDNTAVDMIIAAYKEDGEVKSVKDFPNWM